LAIESPDYSDDHLKQWAQGLSLKSSELFVAEVDGRVVGFADLVDNLLDHLYVDPDFQRQGVATALLDEIEQGSGDLVVYASSSGRPFFEGRGYIVVGEERIDRWGLSYRRWKMALKR